MIVSLFITVGDHSPTSAHRSPTGDHRGNLAFGRAPVHCCLRQVNRRNTMVQIDAAAEVESFRNRGIVRMVMRQLFSTSSQGVGIHRLVREALDQGSKRARAIARETMELVRDALDLNYFRRH